MTTLFLTRAVVFACLISTAAPASAQECAALPAPGVFPGNTTFNNTVRAQMWVDNVNTWWGAFSDASSGIYFYQRTDGNFVKRDFIDGNVQSGKPDTLSNGLELFIVIFESGSLARLYKYIPSFVTVVDPLAGLTLVPTYLPVPGFPVDLPLAGLANAIALHQDSSGKLWATYTSGREVHVIWSTSLDHTTWNTSGMILAPDVADFTTEAATIMHFEGNKIGVVWGNHDMNEIAFRFHRDGDPETSWSNKELVDCCEVGEITKKGRIKGVADDHLSLRAAPDGRLFLVAKDSIGEGRLHLYTRSVNGTWGQKTIVDPDPVAEPTRPVLLLDTENNHAYVIYRESATNAIYFTRTGMNFPAFDPRCVFLESLPDGSRLSDPTTTKQNVDGTKNLVAVASRSGKSTSLPGKPLAPREIFSNVIDLPGGPVSLPVLATTVQAAPVLIAGTPIADFQVIWDNLFSISGVPLDDSQWRWLRGQDVNTVVNLDDGMYDFAQFGFESFLWLPLGADGAPTDVEAEDFLEFIQDSDNQPAHISSAAGDRKATMVALLRFAIDGWSLESALAEAQRLNQGAALSPGQIQWLLGWAATHLPGSHRRN